VQVVLADAIDKPDMTLVARVAPEPIIAVAPPLEDRLENTPADLSIR
jgi:hypothetical protein